MNGDTCHVKRHFCKSVLVVLGASLVKGSGKSKRCFGCSPLSRVSSAAGREWGGQWWERPRGSGSTFLPQMQGAHRVVSSGGHTFRQPLGLRPPEPLCPKAGT